MIGNEQQTPAAMLISPNSESFGRKPHATNLKKPASRWLFLYRFQARLRLVREHFEAWLSHHLEATGVARGLALDAEHTARQRDPSAQFVGRQGRCEAGR